MCIERPGTIFYSKPDLGRRDQMSFKLTLRLQFESEGTEYLS